MRLTIGRHGSNDIVLPGSSTSRRHAELCWDVDEDRPFVEDKNSSNGVDVDGQIIEGRAYVLGDQTKVEIGDHLLLCQLVGEGAAADPETRRVESFPRVKDRTTVRLFSERGATIRGDYERLYDLKRVMILLEEEERTGTLYVTSGASKYKVTFSQGRMVTASNEHGTTGMSAFSSLLMKVSGSYHFTRDLEPGESTINLSPRDLFGDDQSATKKLSVELETE